MQTHTLKRKTKAKRQRQIGRGGKRGTTSGRGTKGQKARSGHRIRPEIRDQIKKLPKKRGYRFHRLALALLPVNLDLIEKTFATSETVSPASLVKKGVIRKNGQFMPTVKILGTGEITKKVIIKNCSVSASAREKIIKVGGKIED